LEKEIACHTEARLFITCIEYMLKIISSREFGDFSVNCEKDEGTMRGYPRVSIVMPSFNGLKLLKISIPSVLKTKYPNFEIIVVDNGSSDGTASFLSKEYPSVKVISLKENKGIVIPFNIGISSADGSLVSFLNNDVEVDPDWLSPLVSAIEANEHLAGCDSKYINYFERNKIDSSGGAGRFIDKYGNVINTGAGEVDRGQFDIQKEVFHASSLFKKNLLIKVGGFDESFFGYYDEADLCWRLHRMGYKILFVPESVIFHIGSATSSTKAFKKIVIFHYYKNKLRMLIKNQSDFSGLFSIIVYLVDLSGFGILLLLTRKQDCSVILLKALIWNVKNFRGTLNNRIKLQNELTDFRKLLLPYSGVWKTILSIQTIKKLFK
jgi:GT2 family glycosyltransferase